MQARLYIDEDAMDDDLVHALRLRGAGVQTALEAGLIGRPDKEHLTHAAEAGRVLYTFNVGDFMRLHRRVPVRWQGARRHRLRRPAALQRRRADAASAAHHRAQVGRGDEGRLRIPQRLAVTYNFTIVRLSINTNFSVRVGKGREGDEFEPHYFHTPRLSSREGRTPLRIFYVPNRENEAPFMTVTRPLV